MPKGSIVLIPFPFTDLSGHKVRPALVLYNQKGGEDCIVSFISSNAEKRVGTYEVRVVPSNNNGLKVNSIIKVGKIATLQKKIIFGQLGMLEFLFLKEVDMRLKALLGI